MLKVAQGRYHSDTAAGLAQITVRMCFLLAVQHLYTIQDTYNSSKKQADNKPRLRFRGK